MKPFVKKLAVLLLIVAVCAIGYQLMKREGFENSTEIGPDFTGMVVVTRDGCKYCEDMADVIESLKAKYPDNFVHMNSSERTPEVTKFMTEQKVDGFPTIKVFENGVATTYEGGRNEDDLTAVLDRL